MTRVLVIGSLPESLINFRGDMIQALRAAGCDVVAAAPAGPAWVDERLAAWGVRRAVLPLSRTGTSLVADLKLVRHLYRLCRQERPDSVLGYTIKPVVYGSIAAGLARVPRIVALVTGLGFTFMKAGSIRQRLVQGIARTLFFVGLRSADVAVFQNPDDEAEFRERGLLHRKLDVRRVAGSGVNVDRYPLAPLPSAGPFRFLLIARLLLDKGVREYIAAAGEIRAQRKDVEFHLVGPHDTNPSAIPRQEIDDAVAVGAIVYHGAADDVRPFLRDCHVYVLPSYREGTPRSVLEALATGRPVITTDAPGCRETIRVAPSRNGVMVPVADAVALAASMRDFLDLPRPALQAMADSSREFAESRFDVRRVNADLLSAMGIHVQASV
jgi:glycosyltransferase involved in cell wall biosynthesis